MGFSDPVLLRSIYRDRSWNHLGWYVNLQAPLHVEGNRFDTTDGALWAPLPLPADWEVVRTPGRRVQPRPRARPAAAAVAISARSEKDRRRTDANVS